MTRRCPDRRGQTLVEFALILPIFVLVLFGILDLGRAVYAYSTINNAAREGARLATVDQTEADIQALAAGHAASLGVPVATVGVDFRLATTPDAANSCDTKVGTSAVVGCLVVVTVPYAYSAATPVISQIVGTFAMQGETRFRIETACPNAAAGLSSCPIGD